LRPRGGKVEYVLSAGTVEEDDDKLEQAVTNVAKRLVGRKAVIKTGTAGMPPVRSIELALCIEASAIRLPNFG
jgi:hypothetical protein